MSGRLILCADDFALSRGISETIAALAGEGKLNAISCMAASPGWPRDSALLRSLPARVQIGLHLVLTEEPPLTAMPGLAPAGRLPTIHALARGARAHRLPIDEIAAEIAAQFERFVGAMGRPPAFVDGHQHAHVLPRIRDVALLETAARARRAWVRNCVDSALAIAARPFRGKAIASAWHAAGFKSAAQEHGLTCNDSFAGHYGFAGDYRALFPRFLVRGGPIHLVMCHPGAGARKGDAIAAARIAEAAALHDLAVGELAAEHGLRFAA